MTHLPPEALAGYLDDALPGEERRQVELHLASCAECRTELAEVRELQRARRRRRWVAVLAPAAAAAVLLVIALPRQAETPSGIRSRSDAEQPLGIVSPTPSAEAAPGPITFTWRSAGPGAGYTFTLQEASGRVVWTSAVADTVTVLPDSIALAPGRTWFWVVDALLPDGRSLSTGIQRLRPRP
jgi:anti-sigma factor RsiW